MFKGGVKDIPFFLVYVSTATDRFSTGDLHDLCGTARRHNASIDVTGALLYHDGSFMEVLEGEEATVRALYDRIFGDPRHHWLEVVTDGFTTGQQFSDWSMAFRDHDANPTDVGAGFSAFMLEHDQSYGERPTIAQRLLLSFRRSVSIMG